MEATAEELLQSHLLASPRRQLVLFTAPQFSTASRALEKELGNDPYLGEAMLINTAEAGWPDLECSASRTLLIVELADDEELVNLATDLGVKQELPCLVHVEVKEEGKLIGVRATAIVSRSHLEAELLPAGMSYVVGQDEERAAAKAWADMHTYSRAFGWLRAHNSFIRTLDSTAKLCDECEEEIANDVVFANIAEAGRLLDGLARNLRGHSRFEEGKLFAFVASRVPHEIQDRVASLYDDHHHDDELKLAAREALAALLLPNHDVNSDLKTKIKYIAEAIRSWRKHLASHLVHEEQIVAPIWLNMNDGDFNGVYKNLIPADGKFGKRSCARLKEVLQERSFFEGRDPPLVQAEVDAGTLGANLRAGIEYIIADSENSATLLLPYGPRGHIATFPVGGLLEFLRPQDGLSFLEPSEETAAAFQRWLNALSLNKVSERSL